jgi:hypothetical protein
VEKKQEKRKSEQTCLLRAATKTKLKGPEKLEGYVRMATVKCWILALFCNSCPQSLGCGLWG